MPEKSPEFVDGGVSFDDRGMLSFQNWLPFRFMKVRRFYMAENFSTKTIRAFHGHKVEEKFVFVVSGSIIMNVFPMDTMDHPERFILSSKKPGLLIIPAGYANGFRALEPNTRVIFFSTTTLDEAKLDDYRFPYDKFGKEIWEAVSR
jgi:dTDP-4-dehydrorhamnose 3,5-epimerase-like enzyme